MGATMDRIMSNLYCLGIGAGDSINGLFSGVRISHNLNKVDRTLSKMDRIRKAYNNSCDPEDVVTEKPNMRSKAVFDTDNKDVETVEFEEGSNVIKKPAEEVKEEAKVEEPKTEPEPEAKAEETKAPEKEEAKTEEKVIITPPPTKAEEKAEPDKEEKPEEAVEQPKEEPKKEEEKEEEPKVEKKTQPKKPKLNKEDIDKIINIDSLQSKTDHKETAKMVADKVISDMLNDPSSELNKKLAESVEEITNKAVEEDNIFIQPKKKTTSTTTRKRPTSTKKR